MTCSITFNAAGPCKTCGTPLNGAMQPQVAAHVNNDGIFCALHCKIHRQADIDWQHEAETISGEQIGLL